MMANFQKSQEKRSRGMKKNMKGGRAPQPDGHAHPQVVPDSVLLQRRQDAHRQADRKGDGHRYEAQLYRDRQLLPDDVVHRAAAGGERGTEVHPEQVVVPHFDVDQRLFQHRGGLLRDDARHQEIPEIERVLFPVRFVQVILGLQIGHDFFRQFLLLVKRTARHGVLHGKGNQGDKKEHQ
jgi:hypothetical protein